MSSSRTGFSMPCLFFQVLHHSATPYCASSFALLAMLRIFPLAPPLPCQGLFSFAFSAMFPCLSLRFFALHERGSQVVQSFSITLLVTTTVARIFDAFLKRRAPSLFPSSRFFHECCDSCLHEPLLLLQSKDLEWLSVHVPWPDPLGLCKLRLRLIKRQLLLPRQPV